MQEYFKIGEISRLYGIGVDSLRYYEKIGLLTPERSESGYRHYSIQDIWRLNIIRDLRALDFSMEQIRRYLESHSVGSTLELLEEEETVIEEKIRALHSLRENVSQRMQTIRRAEQRVTDTISLVQCPPRRCYSIPEGYSREHEMDVLIKRLINMDEKHLYVIGSHQIGTAISLESFRETGKLRYAGVFVISDQGPQELPAGTYLTVTYRGDYAKSEIWAHRLLEYARRQGIRLKGDFLEILWVDIHISADKEEHVTELQILTEP